MSKSKLDRLPKIIVLPPVRDGLFFGVNVRFYNKMMTFGFALDPLNWGFAAREEDDIFYVALGPFAFLIGDLV